MKNQFPLSIKEKKTIPFSIILFSYLLFCLAACQSKDMISSKAIAPPNVILILTDDQGYGDVGSHGHPILKTPNIDAFAETAVEATNFHVGTTCSPTRAGLLTGRNANRNNAWHTIAGCSILNKEEETLAQFFQKNAYQTGMFGKWHLGDNFPYRPQDRGFQEALYCGGGGVWQTPDYWTNDYFDDTYYRNGIPEKQEGYCTDVWFSEAIKFIDKNKSKPFFVYLTPNAAHGPFNVLPTDLAKYEKTDLPPKLKRFNGMVSNLDANFGKLLKYLDVNQLAANTIVIYTTDNGTAGGVKTDKLTGKKYGYNANLRGQKGSQYDGGHRVPFYIRYPNGELIGGKKTDELIAHVDILPTLENLCGLKFKASNPLDGTNRISQLKNTESDTSRMLVIDTQRNQWPEKGRNSCVLSKDWRLVNGSELYHTKSDPGQQIDVSPKYPNRVKQMQTFYDTWWASTEKDWHYAKIPIGNPQANPTLITIHDFHATENLAWNQVQIRRANKHPKDGFYSIEVAKAGTYEFKLSRYPPDSNLALDAEALEIPALPHRDPFPTGEKLMIKEAIVEIGALIVKEAANSSDRNVNLQTKLSAGAFKLKTWFVLANGEKIPAYYNLIERI